MYLNRRSSRKKKKYIAGALYLGLGLHLSRLHPKDWERHSEKAKLLGHSKAARYKKS